MAFLQNEINRGHEPLARTFGTPINRGHESSREKSIGDTNLWHTNQSGTRIFTRRFSKRLCFSVRGDEKIQCLLMARDSAADGRAER